MHWHEVGVQNRIAQSVVHAFGALMSKHDAHHTISLMLNGLEKMSGKGVLEMCFSSISDYHHHGGASKQCTPQIWASAA